MVYFGSRFQSSEFIVIQQVAMCEHASQDLLVAVEVANGCLFHEEWEAEADGKVESQNPLRGHTFHDPAPLPIPHTLAPLRSKP